VAKRDYKKEYKKYGKSKAAKLYRAILNRINNRKKKNGQSSVGDGMDESHTGKDKNKTVKKPQSQNRANNRPRIRHSRARSN